MKTADAATDAAQKKDSHSEEETIVAPISKLTAIQSAPTKAVASGLLLAVLSLAGWGVFSMTAAGRDARRATGLRSAYASLEYHAALERAVAQRSMARREADVRAFLAASRGGENALLRARVNAADADLPRVASLARLHSRALFRMAQLNAALDAGSTRKARGLLERVDSDLRSLAAEADDAGRDMRLREIGRWPRTKLELASLASAGLVFFLGLVAAVAPLIRAVGYRRRRDLERQAELRRLEQVALTDSLTGLRNHRAFHEDLKREIERRNRSGQPFSLLMVDLNGLKQVNDTHGHQAGDERIRSAADCLKSVLRGADSAYRVGGDEFTVILPGERAWGALNVAQRIHAEVGKRRGFVAISVGISESTGTESKDALIRHADLALYEAKRSHLGTVVYSPGLEPTKHPTDQEAHRHHQKLLATALARAVDAKDSGTRNHCETVSELSAMLGRQLGLEPERVAKLRVAGLLHDVGKIGIADSILQKPDGLEEDESEIMRTHTAIGHNIVSAAELDEEADWVLHHHEHYDGGGYPSSLAGEEIPLESRIILVADAFEAITADRPYRRGRSPEEALDELIAHAGAQFDPTCVAALCALFDYRPASALEGVDELAARRNKLDREALGRIIEAGRGA